MTVWEQCVNEDVSICDLGDKNREGTLLNGIYVGETTGNFAPLEAALNAMTPKQTSAFNNGVSSKLRCDFENLLAEKGAARANRAWLKNKRLAGYRFELQEGAQQLALFAAMSAMLVVGVAESNPRFIGVAGLTLVGDLARNLVKERQPFGTALTNTAKFALTTVARVIKSKVRKPPVRTAGPSMGV